MQRKHCIYIWPGIRNDWGKYKKCKHCSVDLYIYVLFVYVIRIYFKAPVFSGNKFFILRQNSILSIGCGYIIQTSSREITRLWVYTVGMCVKKSFGEIVAGLSTFSNWHLYYLSFWRINFISTLLFGCQIVELVCFGGRQKIVPMQIFPTCAKFPKLWNRAQCEPCEHLIWVLKSLQQSFFSVFPRWFFRHIIHQRLCLRWCASKLYPGSGTICW